MYTPPMGSGALTARNPERTDRARLSAVFAATQAGPARRTTLRHQGSPATHSSVRLVGQTSLASTVFFCSGPLWVPPPPRFSASIAAGGGCCALLAAALAAAAGGCCALLATTTQKEGDVTVLIRGDGPV